MTHETPAPDSTIVTITPPSWSQAVGACDLALAEGDLAAAESWARRALAHADDDVLRATAHHRLAVLFERANRLPEALQEVERAVQLDEQSGGPVTVPLARDLHSRGIIRTRMGEHDLGQADLARSLGITDRLGGDDERLTTMLALAPVLAATGRLVDAALRYEQALELAERLDGQHSLRCLRALGGIADVARSQRQLPRAHRAWLEVTRRLAGLPPTAPVRLRAELGLAWLGLAWLAHEGRQATFDARAMFSFAVDVFGDDPHPAASFAAERLEALGGPLPPPQHPIDPAEPPVVVFWNPRAGMGDVAHPFGGRWTIDRARAGEELIEGQRVPWELLDQPIGPG